MVLTTGRPSIDENRVIFHYLNWQSYQQTLTALGEHRAARLICDRGTLEITMPLKDGKFISFKTLSRLKLGEVLHFRSLRKQISINF